MPSELLSCWCIDGFLSVWQCLANAKSTFACSLSLARISTSKRGSNVLLNDVYPNEYHCWIAAYFFNDLSWRYYHPIFFFCSCHSFLRAAVVVVSFARIQLTATNQFQWHSNDGVAAISSLKHTTFEESEKKQFVDSSHLHQIRWHFSFLIFASFSTCANVILGVDWLRSECDMFLEYEIFLKHFVSENTRTRPLFANVSMGFSANRAANRWSQMLK